MKNYKQIKQNQVSKLKRASDINFRCLIICSVVTLITCIDAVVGECTKNPPIYLCELNFRLRPFAEREFKAYTSYLKLKIISIETSLQSSPCDPITCEHVSSDKRHLSLIWTAARATIKKPSLLQVHLFLWNKLHCEVLFHSCKELTF